MKKFSILLCFLVAITGGMGFFCLNKNEKQVVYATINENVAVEEVQVADLPSQYCLRDDYVIFT